VEKKKSDKNKNVAAHSAKRFQKFKEII